MRQQVEHRLHELKAEWASGQQMLADLEAQQQYFGHFLSERDEQMRPQTG